MKRFIKTITLLTFGFVTAAGVAALVGLPGRPHPSTQGWRQTGELAKQSTPQEITAFEVEIERLKGELRSDLTTLRSQLARIDRDQDSTSQQLSQLAEQLTQTVSIETGQNAEEALTPEQEQERAQARVQADLMLMEGALLAEQPDPAWANMAQFTLQTTFQQKAIPGLEMVDAECRSTLCRMEIALDDPTMQDGYQNLLNLAPWSGESLIQIDTETGVAVMYLAREDRTLPQVTD